MSKNQFDLHLHTYYSDGVNAPEDLLRRIKKQNLALASFTDHNSIRHIRQEILLAKKLKVNFLPGIEISVVYEGRHLHLLGYNFDYKNPELEKIIFELGAKRRAGIFKVAAKLRNLGFDIQNSELKKLRAEYFGLSHIIHILLKKPQERKRIIKEAGSADIFAIINFYFTEAGDAYVPEGYLPAVKMIKLIKATGGFTSLAHPGSHLRLYEDGLIAKLAAGGLDGLEVFTPKHNWDQIIHYEVLAKKLRLAVTAGSNYHEDFHQHDIPIVTPLGFLKTPPKVYAAFLQYLQEHTNFKPIY